MEELWKDIKGYENFYQVSNLGRIKSLTGFNRGGYYKRDKILNQYITTTGYKRVDLTSNKKTKMYKVHRLIAQAFIPNSQHKKQINHINGNKLDNRIENLEWCTARENIIHAYDTGLNNRVVNISEQDINNIIDMYIKKEYSLKEISKKFKISFSRAKRLLEVRNIKIKRYNYNLEQFDFKNEIKNKTRKDLAKQIGCSRTTINLFLKKRGIKKYEQSNFNG